MIPRRLNRIPEVTPHLKSEKYVKDLTKLTRLELIEIKEREQKLLANKKNINCLPDKGARIKEFYEKLRLELETRDQIDKTAKLFSELNIVARGQTKLNQLEWDGRLVTEHNNNSDHIDDVLDSDDEIEMDPLEIIAQRSLHGKKIKVIVPEDSFITQSDLIEIASFEKKNTHLSTHLRDAEILDIDVNENISSLRPKLLKIIKNATNSTAVRSSSSSPATTVSREVNSENHSNLDPHVLYIVDKVVDALPEKEKYKPYRTTIANTHDPEKEKKRKKGKNWENTAATPPLIQHNGTKLLSILDSVELQTNYLSKLKELQEQQAAERLTAKIKRIGKIYIPTIVGTPAFTTYRDNLKIEGIHTYSDEDEIHDPLCVERTGSGVKYTVFE